MNNSKNLWYLYVSSHSFVTFWFIISSSSFSFRGRWCETNIFLFVVFLVTNPCLLSTTAEDLADAAGAPPSRVRFFLFGCGACGRCCLSASTASTSRWWLLLLSFGQTNQRIVAGGGCRWRRLCGTTLFGLVRLPLCHSWRVLWLVLFLAVRGSAHIMLCCGQMSWFCALMALCHPPWFDL